MSKLNPFALLDIDLVFDLDETVLEAHYLAKQQDAHPDRFMAGMDVDAIAAATLRSSNLNTAYSKLRDPISRAKALIETLTLDIDVNAPPPQVLMLAMEEREEVDDAPSHEVKLALKQALSVRLTENLASLSRAFSASHTERIAFYFHLCLYQQKLIQDLRTLR